jgi:hypothetical protein
MLGDQTRYQATAVKKAIAASGGHNQNQTTTDGRIARQRSSSRLNSGVLSLAGTMTG